MIVPIYIVLKDGSDRPYVSTTPPSPERREALKKDGCEVHRADVDIPGWVVEDKIIRSVAVPDVG